MSNYLLKTIGDGFFSITRERQKIGFVRKLSSGDNAGQFCGRIGKGDVVIRGTSEDVFRELVAIENRISLCGKNDKALAQEALAKQNERTYAEAERQREELEPLNEIARKFGFDFGPRVRRRRIAL